MVTTVKCPYCGAGWKGTTVSQRHLRSCKKRHASQTKVPEISVREDAWNSEPGDGELVDASTYTTQYAGFLDLKKKTALLTVSPKDGDKLIALIRDPETSIEVIREIAALDEPIYGYRIEYEGDGTTLFAGTEDVTNEVYEAILALHDVDAETLGILGRSEKFNKGLRRDVVRRVLFNPQTPPDVIRNQVYSGRDNPRYLMSWALANPNCPSDVVLDAALRSTPKDPYFGKAHTHPNCPPEFHSVSDPSTPSADIDRLTTTENYDIASRAIAHPNVTVNGITQAARSDNGSLRVQAAESPKATAELVISLVDDPDDKVRAAAIHSKAMPADFISERLARSVQNGTSPHHFIQAPNAPRESLERMVKWGKGRHPDRKVRKEVKRVLKQRDTRAA